MGTTDDKPKTAAINPMSFAELTTVGVEHLPIGDELTLRITPVEGEMTDKMADLSAVKSTLLEAFGYTVTCNKLRVVEFDASVAHLDAVLVRYLTDALWIAAVITFIKAFPPKNAIKKEWIKRNPELKEKYDWVREPVRNWKLAHRGSRKAGPTSNTVIAGIVHSDEGTPEGSMVADLPNPKLSHSPTDEEWLEVATLIRSALDFVSLELEHEKAAIQKKIWDEIPNE